MIILGCEMGGNPPFKETPIWGFTKFYHIFSKKVSININPYLWWKRDLQRLGLNGTEVRAEMASWRFSDSPGNALHPSTPVQVCPGAEARNI